MSQYPGQDQQPYYGSNAGYGWGNDQNHGSNEAYGWEHDQNQPSYSYDMGAAPDFGSDQPFTSFDYSQPQANAGYPQTGYGDVSQNPLPNPYTGSILTPSPTATYESNPASFEDEPPLLEELGINFDHIILKTRAVLNPFRETDASIMQDTDLAGPLVFCLGFGGLLLLAGKVHFNYIYGIGMLGCIGMYFLLNLMALSGVSIGVIISVLGYCLLPMVGLAGLGVLLPLGGAIGIIFAAVTVLWCSLAASKLFVTALAMDHQQPLVAYPCAMVYGVFALLAIF